MFERINPLEIVGRRFGNLVVDSYNRNANNKHYYNCRCDCGRTCIRHYYPLVLGIAKDCGCSRIGRGDPEDIVGMRLNRIVVLENVGTEKIGDRTMRMYRCRCDCGKEFVAPRLRLINGEVQSCGDCTKIIPENDYYRYVCIDGDSFIFDEEDLELVRSHRWYISNGYPVTRFGGGKYRKLSRMILGLEDNAGDVDHRDGDTRNQRRNNLRYSTHHENMANVKLRSDNKTGYKGVSWARSKKKYCTQIQSKGRHRFIGYFSTPIEAARAYDKVARSLFGEFARLNFPQVGEQGCRNEELEVCNAS